MKMSIYFALLLLLSSFAAAGMSNAESADEEIRDVIEQLFDAMRQSDGDAVESLFTEGAILQTVRSSGGENTLSKTPIEMFASSVESSEPGQLDEHIHSVSIHVDGGLATAWMHYTFYYNGSFSHCGVNTINLLETVKGWKIFSIADTRRQQGCLD